MARPIRDWFRNVPNYNECNCLFQIFDDGVSQANREFVQEAVTDKYTNVPIPAQNQVEWTPSMRRAGVIARKIGVVPLWLNNGKKVMTTMLQVR